MSETRKKIGLILPSSNTTTEPDFQSVLPPDVSLHTSRIWVVDVTDEDLEAMNSEAEQAARYVGTAAVDVIAYACTSGSFIGGPGYDQALLARIVDAAGGPPAIGTSPAMIEALRSSGVRKVSIVTPYTDAINERMAAFVEAHGFDVLRIRGQQIVPNLEIGAQSPEAILAFARENLDADADGYFLSCTNWRAMEIADELERESGKPVVTSNQATVWATFRVLGLTVLPHGAPQAAGKPTPATPEAAKAADL
jgi:maleate isomerase